MSYSRGEQLNMADEVRILSISLMSLLSFNHLFGRILCQILNYITISSCITITLKSP